MKLDCTNQDCPKPVISTKNALEKLQTNEILEVVLNSESSVENVVRFAKNNAYDVQIEHQGSITKLYISKCLTCKNENDIQVKQDFINTTLFLKDDKIGKGKLGKKLMIGFLNSILEQKRLPKRITCVNKAVFLTTAKEDSDIINILKGLENKGVEIYSCGVCLSFFDIEKKLKVGQIGNAYDTVTMLLDGSISL